MPGVKQHLAEERGLLIAGDAGKRNVTAVDVAR